MTTEKNHYTPNEYISADASDSDMINAAIVAAAEAGCGIVKIPLYNKRRGKNLWVIDKTIMIPSHTRVILDGCRLEMADGVYAQMFANSEAFTANGRRYEGEQTDIHIEGRGGAVIGSGKDNGLDEYTSCKNGMPHVSQNNLIYLHNVADFTITGLTVEDQRWWAMLLMYARRGEIRDIRFCLKDKKPDGVWRNQDGIDLRVGCSDISIENISGETGDDMIALTALFRTGAFETRASVEGRDTDIHHVRINNVRGFTHQSALVRLLCHQRCNIYDISISDLFETGRIGKDPKCSHLIWLGEDGYYATEEERMKSFELRNIVIRNVHSRAMCAVNFGSGVENVHISDIYVYGDGQSAADFGVWYVTGNVGKIMTENEVKNQETVKVIPCAVKGRGEHLAVKNVLMENVYFAPTCGVYMNSAAENAPAVFGVNGSRLENVKVINFVNVTDRENMRYGEVYSGSVELKK